MLPFIVKLSCMVVCFVNKVHSSALINNMLIRLEDVVKVNNELKQVIVEQKAINEEINATIATINATIAKQRGKR